VASENPNDGRKDRHDVYVTPKAMWKVKNTFCAVGQCEAISEFDAKAAENVLVMVDVTENKYTPEGQTQERITTKCDTLLEWPADYGGAGTRLQ
jgi:hypothetical protein